MLPGVIDDQVHFRDSDFTQREIFILNRAAVAGGVTSFMEQPNTSPPATTIELLEQKYSRAAEVSLADYSFFMGTTNSNLDELLKLDPKKVCGVKVFWVHQRATCWLTTRRARSHFEKVKMLIAIHAEDDVMIHNLGDFKEKYGDDIPVEAHPLIRSRQACLSSSSKAIARAKGSERDFTFSFVH